MEYDDDEHDEKSNLLKVSTDSSPHVQLAPIAVDNPKHSPDPLNSAWEVVFQRTSIPNLGTQIPE